MPKLLVEEGPNMGKKYELGEETVLGRSFDTQLRVDDLTVSRRHARIKKADDGYTIEDLKSGNGTYLNGKRVSGILKLKDGDKIRICRSVFVFCDDAPKAGTTAVSFVEEEDTSGTSAIEKTVDAEQIDAEDLQLTTREAPGATEQLLRIHKRLKTVCSISNDLAEILDREKLLEAILDKLFEVFPQTDRGFIILKDDETGELVPYASKVRGQEEAGNVTISKTIVNEVINNGKGVLSSDAMDDERFAQGVSIVNFQIRSMMCTPLCAKGNLLGIIHLDTTHRGRRFSEEDLGMLMSISMQTALAIENAKMHESLLKRQRIEQDLRFAREIQHSFLPENVPEIEGYEFSKCYATAQEVGGDFYDFIELSDDQLGIVIGDVSGKGVPAALLMARMMSDVRFFSMAEREPARVLKKLNDALTRSGPEDVFVTLLYILLDVREAKVTIGNAAHPPPIIRSTLNGNAEAMPTTVNFPLGVVEDADFDQAVFPLSKGDIIAIFTDGVTEAMDSQRNQYGTNRLIEVIKQDLASTDQVMEAILADVNEFVRDTPQSDDLTLVCFGPRT